VPWFSSKKAPLDLQKMDVRLPQTTAAILAGAGVPRFREALPTISAELARARRYGRTLTVVLFAVDGAQPSGTRNGHPEAERDAASALCAAALAALLRETMRDIDIVTYASTLGRCVVVMPEVDRGEALLAVNRLRDLCARRLALPVRADLAVFPRDGLTLEELVRVAEAKAEPSTPAPLIGGSQEGTAY
jgi:hypothetical protein